MKWNADAFFAQGKTHMVCEDYARAGTQQNGLPYALVCDGCSSSPDTDIGARLVASATAFQMHWIASREATFSERERLIIDAAANAANEVDVGLRSLDSTLIAAYHGVDEDGNVGVRVSMRGDGVVVSRMHDGGWGFYVVEHEHNAPRYLSYDIDPARLEGYLHKYGETSSWRPYSSDSGWIPAGAAPYKGHPKDWFFEAEYYDLVMILSDGVQTFQRVAKTGTSKSLEDVPMEQVVEQLLKVKGTSGEFLKRRCHKFLSKFCAINEWQHADDFSAAAIWMGEPDAE